MNKGQGKDIFLRWINQATASGLPADPMQYADYTDKYEYLLDSVIKFLAKFRPIKAQVTILSGDVAVDTSILGYTRITLPLDLSKINSVENLGDSVQWRLQGKSTIIISNLVVLPIDIFYDKKPTYVAPNSDISIEFELDEDVHILVPLKCAIMATKGDDPSLSDELQIEFNQLAPSILNDTPLYGNSIKSVYTMG
jgi:hypothetical protein